MPQLSERTQGRALIRLVWTVVWYFRHLSHQAGVVCSGQSDEHTNLVKSIFSLVSAPGREMNHFSIWRAFFAE